MKINTVAVSAGGTGGHIIPALNVSKALRDKGITVHYIGNENSMEYNIMTKNGFPFHKINVQKLYRKFTIKHLFFPFKLIKSIITSIKYLKQKSPDAFIGFGGFVSGPPAIAAFICRIPIYMQEQNCRPGITNRLTAKIAKHIFVAHPESQKYFPIHKTTLTGNPVNALNYSHSENPTDIPPELNVLRKDSKKLLILGGSQGSLFINSLILNHLDWFYDQNIDIIWQTGTKHLQKIKEQTSQKKGVFAFDFTDKLNSYYRIANYCIARGGALTLAEIDVFQIPSFIIPLSSAAVNEQYYNAKAMESQKKCVVFEEKYLTQFKEKFKWFTENASYMYTEKSESIHIMATKKIVNLIMGEQNE
jgi:UDP-N-acetylglucosamine--N-acetylmuramyl-(pentapeptide) pyrophosphoryl-undecaprenol N-acetylglucosamine transferase